MGILERIAATRGETRYSADTYLSEYLIPFNYGGNSYFTGGPGLVQTLSGNRATEIVNTLPGYSAALRQCPPAFAAQMVRAMVLSQARFTFRNRKKKTTFTNTKLEPLDRPWTGATTGELIARNEWHAGVAGNAYTVRQRNRLRVLRPDWVAILYGSHQEPEDAAHALDGELIGYVYQNGGLWSDRGNPTTLLPEDVAHWSPIPDPESAGVGMSWITPAIRDMQKDRLSAEHTIRFFEGGATPNLVVKGLTATTKEQFDALVDMMEGSHAGIANAYRTMYLTAGADATVVGSNLADLDLKNVQGAAETRIASLSRVHPVILGIAEGLAGSSLNAGNFGMARRIWADTWIYPTLQDLASTLGTIIDVPSDAELWFDTSDIPLLREDGLDAAEIAFRRSSAIRQLTDAGYTWESSVQAVVTGDMTVLKHSGLYSVQLQPAGAQPAPPRPKPALPAARHLPGKHNQLTHGRKLSFRPSGGDSRIDLHSDGDRVLVRITPTTGDDEEVSGEVTLSATQARQLRNDLTEAQRKGKAAAKKANAIYDAGDVPSDDLINSPIATGTAGDLSWEMWLDGNDPLSHETTIGVGDTEAVLSARDLPKFLGTLDTVHADE